MKMNPFPHALILAIGLVAIYADTQAAPVATRIVFEATASSIDLALATAAPPRTM